MGRQVTSVVEPRLDVPEPATAPPRLELKAVSKSFGPVQALNNVHLTIRPGEIHGLVGQNGSGKSTLVKVLSGYYRLDRGGSVVVDGNDLGGVLHQQLLRDNGIAIVHQDFGLVDDKSVAENICVGAFSASRWTRRISWAREAETAAAVLRRLDSDIDPLAMVSTLGPADRSVVAMARAIRSQQPGRGVVVFDESTRALSSSALDDFYATVRQMVDSGTSVLMISHNLEEVMHLTDRVTVLRDGQVTASSEETASLSERDIAHFMLGRSVDEEVKRRPVEHRDVHVDVTGVCGKVVDDLSLEIVGGEVVGVTGVSGAGWEELAELLFGSHRARAGTLTINGQTHTLRSSSVADSIRNKVAYVPESRATHGLALDLSIAENITLPLVRAVGRPWSIGSAWQALTTRTAIDRLNVRPAEPGRLVGQLSGGNQQKVLLGKWLATEPDLLILNEPTQAVDVGARQEVLQAIRTAADDGSAVLLASIQAADLAAVCDRVLVMREGRIVHELTGNDITPDSIVDAVFAHRADTQKDTA